MRILYLDLDTLRPDHLGCYGYHRNTSPNIDSIAQEGVRFTNYFCSDAPCLPSRTALMTGRFGIHTGVVGHAGTAADIRIEGERRSFTDMLRTESIPGFLRNQAGMKTVSISPFADRHSSWSFYAGFNEIHDTGRYGMESAEEITPVALQWIEQNAKRDNWFLHINYWDAHTPYRAPAEFGNPFEKDPLPSWFTSELLEQHRAMVGPHNSREINMFDNATHPAYPRHLGEIKDMVDLKRFVDGYDCGIRYMDSQIGRLFQAFRDIGVWDDLVIIISADHGENIGELGLYGEHATADQLTCHIPMIIRWPGKQQGSVDDKLHYNLDLAPTLADLMKLAPSLVWDGQSYAPAITEGKPCGRDYLVLSQCAHVCQRGVRFGSWVYMRTYHDGFHLFKDEMLFDVDGDPHEQFDLSEQHPDICKDAVYYLNQWHDDMMKTMSHDIDPLWTVIKEGGPSHARGRLKEYCEYLKKTERDWAIPDLMKRHPREFE